MAKKLLAFLLTFALLLSTVTSAVMVTTAEDVTTEIPVWDGSIATEFAGGSGTKTDPYLISNGAELAYMFNSVITTGSSFCNNKYFKLTANIYLNDVTNADWKDNNPTPWLVSKADNGFRFTGNFDGDGHTVYGMYYSGESGYVGLLPVVDTWSYDVVIKDIAISDSYISTTGNIVGGITPRLYSANYNTAHFYNVLLTESVTISATGGDYAGGLIGFSNCDAKSYYQFSGCAVLADISTGHALIGHGSSATKANIVQSYTTADDWYTTYSGTNDTTYIISDVSTISGKDNAKTAMPGFDWLRIWNCKADGYPFPMDYNTNNVTGLVWTGLWAAEYAGGTGTSEDPYIIETPEQLARMVKYSDTNGYYYKITRDLYLNDVSNADWKTNSPKSWFDTSSIRLNSSSKAIAFVGNVDGTGHTIHGLYYNGSKTFGLLPYAQNSYIGHLRLSNSDITSSGAIAALIGQGVTKVSLAYCVVDETVNITGSGDTAGFVAYGTPSVYIDSSASTANITGATNVGAFIGDCWFATGVEHVINNSYGIDYPLDAKLGFTSSNCYNTVAETKSFTEGEVVNLGDKALMKGADALKNMTELDFFGTTDSYPVIYQQGTKGAVWSGSTATEYAKGSGTKIAPYIIETAEQLVKLVKDTNTEGKYYAITADIKLNDTTAENWTETAKQWFSAANTSSFAGTLDGSGYTVSGIYYNGAGFASLIPQVTGTTAFKNIRISNSSLTNTGSGNDNNVSALISKAYGTITIENCMIDDTVALTSTASAAGLAGYGTATVTAKNCGIAAVISAPRRPGAFIADVWSGTQTISNSYAAGSAFTTYRKITSTNSYSTASDNSSTNVVTLEQMQGLTALNNMSLLTGYFATEGYPVRFNDGVAGTTWSGAVAPEFASGDGSKASPFVIKTGEQLARMLTIASEDVYFKLGADIILSDENKSHNWFDSTNAAIFAGELNGNGYIISGLNYNATVTGGVYAGLIPVANGAYISNVILENSIIDMYTDTTTATYVGGIVGYITGATNLYSCYVADSVELYNTINQSIEKKLNALGGLIGGGNSGFTIDGCAFFGTLDGFDYRYGAVFGDVWGGTDATRIVKYTMVDKYVPSSRWGFSGKNNASTVEPALFAETPTDVDASFTVAETIKGDEGYELAQKANWNGRYFGTENYPVLSTLAKRFGDVNGDRIRNSSDLVMIIKNLINATKLGYNDVNADGKINVLDLVNLKKKFLNASVKDGYDLVWSDEFDGTALDETKWNTSQTRMPDTEELAQSSNGSVRSVSNGNLQLSAIKNPWYNASSEKYFEQHKYMTTGSVTTEGKMSYQYGYLEVRAKVPYKEGCWPSFWLRSHNSTEKQANPDFEVEVDVLEVFGSKNTMSSNLHQQSYNGNSYNTSTSSINDMEVHTFENATNLSQEYHTYAFEWEPDRMAIYVDGELQCEWNIDKVSLWSYGLKANTTGFDTTMNILFNNHLFTESSSFVPSSGNTIENYEGNLPAEFDIDYVRLYQKNDGFSKLILGE